MAAKTRLSLFLRDVRDRLGGRDPALRRMRTLAHRVATLRPEGGEPRGHVLFRHHLQPFLWPEEAERHDHTLFWEVRRMARGFLDRGYGVDVIHVTNRTFRPRRPYVACVVLRGGLEKLAPHLPAGCVKVLHSDAAHWLDHNAAQYERLRALRARRGVVLEPVKLLDPYRGLDHADLVTVLGNEYTIGTFARAGKEIRRVPLSAPFAWPWPEGKDFGACRRRFLWFGGAGLVHKGLDLVLEAFAAAPELHLTVCGPIDGEPDFEAAFRRELYETPNIETLGFVDVARPAFRELADRTAATVFASCAEGGGGGVLTCLHAGLVPIATRESSVDLEDFGFPLEDATVDGIIRQTRAVAALPAAELETRARAAWAHARAYHTREHFGRRWDEVVDEILARAPKA